MPNTADGYTYPLATAPVRNGAADIQALATQLRPNGVMAAGQAPIWGGAGFDKTQVRLAAYNMDIATNSSGVAVFGNIFPTVVLGLWIQQIYNGTQNMAHFTMAGINASTVSILCRATNNGANFASQYFSVNVMMMGY
jgi:hypothetical protein